MDDDLQQLEAELKRLRPVAPATRVAMNIARELEARRPSRLWWLGVALPAAAALAFLLVRPEPPAVKAPQLATVVSAAPQPVFKPVAAENVLLEAEELGHVTLADGSSARRVRKSYLDTITWKDPRGRASLKWTVPREEERIVPVVFQ